MYKAWKYVAFQACLQLEAVPSRLNCRVTLLKQSDGTSLLGSLFLLLSVQLFSAFTCDSVKWDHLWESIGIKRGIVNKNKKRLVRKCFWMRKDFG